MLWSKPCHWFLAFSQLLRYILPSSSQESKEAPSLDMLFNDFASGYWRDGDWKGSNSWTGDNISRLILHYIISFEDPNQHDKVDELFVKIVSRSLNKWTIVQCLTQGYDDFGWTIFLLLELLEHSYRYEEKYPNSSVAIRLPILRNRFAFRAAFLHDIMEDSWSTDICGGGSEWKVRARRVTLWPSQSLGGVYKNSITNHLYNANNAQIYNAFPRSAHPVDVTEIAFHYLRLFWKLLRPVFGWPRTKFRQFDFTDMQLLQRAAEGLKWMEQAQLRTTESLYIDGQRLRFIQSTPEQYPRILCNRRNEALFTYNQVSGIRALRFLSQATGRMEPLQQGHETIRNLINASYSGRLGWNGILEDSCDRFGNCTQDMQMFKALPFLDIKKYCEPVQEWLTSDIQSWHRRQCEDYRVWIKANAAAARKSIDRSGKFAGYWGSKFTVNEEDGRGRTIETQASGLSVLLTSLWFETEFG